MEKMPVELMGEEENPEVLGDKFNSEEFIDFVAKLRQKVKANPSVRFNIVADWVNVEKTRSAKALMDQYAEIGRAHV